MTETDSRVLVRRLEPHDWAELKAVRLTALADTPYAFASTLERELELPDEHWRDWLHSTAAIFGAYRPGHAGVSQAGQPMVGMAGAYIRPSGSPDDWHLISMWVSPAARGLGVGGQLVEAVCSQARQAGARIVTLWVADINARARSFYHRLGFEPTGRRQPVRPDEPDHTETELARELG